MTGNTISNLTTEGEGAVQVADGVEGMTVTIKENTISDCQAAVAIHNGCSGTPASVTVEENGVTGIWMSVPIGWVLADLTGVLYYIHISRKRN